MMIKGILFDFDGTLMNSNSIHIDGFVKLKEKYNLNIDMDTVIEMFGMSTEVILEKLTDLPSDKIKKMTKEKRDFCIKLFKEKGFPEESVDLIKTLRYRGFKIGIVTGAHETLIRSVMPKGIVDVVYGAESGMRPKPFPDMLLAAARDIGLKPEECVYIGDSPNDCKAAHNAKMKFIGIKADITWDGLEDLHPYKVLYDIKYLLKIFNHCPKVI